MQTRELIKILACPKCGGKLVEVVKDADQGFACADCQLVYPVIEEIPVMLIERALPMTGWRPQEG